MPVCCAGFRVDHLLLEVGGVPTSIFRSHQLLFRQLLTSAAFPVQEHLRRELFQVQKLQDWSLVGALVMLNLSRLGLHAAEEILTCVVRRDGSDKEYCGLRSKVLEPHHLDEQGALVIRVSSSPNERFRQLRSN